jgi:hypothetical protein
MGMRWPNADCLLAVYGLCWVLVAPHMLGNKSGESKNGEPHSAIPRLWNEIWLDGLSAGVLCPWQFDDGLALALHQFHTFLKAKLAVE